MDKRQPSMVMAMTLGTTLRATALLMTTIVSAMAGPLENANAALVATDYATALALYRPLADQGDPSAQVNLGFMYDEGFGVAQDYAEAVKWYRRAADQGEPQGLSNLANMYRDGVGVAQDDVQAHLWFDLAAKRFATEEKRDAAAKDRDHVGAKMTPAQIAEANRLAQQWKPKSQAAERKSQAAESWWEWMQKFFGR